MRISIRIQLAALVLVAALLGLAVIAVATWITNFDFVYDVSTSNLALTASIKASQIASSLALMQALVRNIATRTTIQVALRNYYLSNSSATDWIAARDDVTVTLDSDPGAGFLLQAVVLGYNSSRRFIAQTAPSLLGRVELPEKYENGSSIFLGDDSEVIPYAGYPGGLYPNLTLECVETVAAIDGSRNSTCQSSAALDGFSVGRRTLLLGPYHVNSSVSLISMTSTIVNTNNTEEVLGWMTVVLDAQLILNSVDSREGLKRTGSTLVVGSTNTTNRFPPAIISEMRSDDPKKESIESEPFRFLFSPNPGALRQGDPSDNNCPPGSACSADPDPISDLPEIRPGVRTGNKPTGAGTKGQEFLLSSFPPVMSALVSEKGSVNNAGSSIDTTNEKNEKVSVGYAIPPTSMVDWVVLVEQEKAEVWAPIERLRQVLAVCAVGTAGVMALLSFPISHYSTSPIRRLRDATRASVCDTGEDDDGENSEEKGLVVTTSPSSPAGETNGSGTGTEGAVASARRFRIPEKVKDRAHFVNDELTDLTRTFNAMADELLLQYTRLDERVKQRTAQLEASKIAAEAAKAIAEKANESKSIFIANVSHELKTPLNGIMGMAALLRDEEEMKPEWRDTLDVVYYCGELLLKLVTDLLTFSKHQAGYTLLDTRDFHLSEVGRVVSINLGMQAQEKGIQMKISYKGIQNLKVRGDKDRLVQVVTNLLSNAIKFTPKGGVVTVCFSEKKNAGKFGRQSQTALVEAVPESELHTRAPSVDTNVYEEPSFDSNKLARPMNTAVKAIEALTALSSSDQNSLPFKKSARMPKPPLADDKEMAVGLPADQEMFSFNGTATTTAMLDETAFSENLVPNKDTSTPLDSSDKHTSFDPAVATVPIRPDGDDIAGSLDRILLRITVTDTGPGVPAQIRSHIFEPFFQGELGLEKRYGGTGLGLSICRQLVTLMGGEVFCRNRGRKRRTLREQQGPSDEPLSRLNSADSSEYNPDHCSDSEPESISETNIDADGNVTGARFVAIIPLALAEARPSVEDDVAKSVVSELSPHDNTLIPVFDFSQTAPSEDQPARVSSVLEKPSELIPAMEIYQNPNMIQIPPPVPRPSPDRTISAPLTGSTIKFTPSGGSSSVADLAGSARTGSPDQLPLRVLVADDNGINRDVVRRMLSFAGVHSVDVACDGREAYEAVARAMGVSRAGPLEGDGDADTEADAGESDEPALVPSGRSSNSSSGPASADSPPPPPAAPYDLILMDIQMPHLSGLASTRLIRELGFGGTIVALSAYSEESNVADCLDAGMDSFVGKPVKREWVEKVVREVREGKSRPGGRVEAG